MTTSLHPRALLADMLGKSLGAEAASAAVESAAQSIGAPEKVDRITALALLEQIAQQPGIVGIAARFAKSRVHLVWGGKK